MAERYDGGAAVGGLLERPDWEGAGRVHDWRNHVGEKVQAIWHTLTLNQRLAMALDADDRAGNEHWD